MFVEEHIHQLVVVRRLGRVGDQIVLRVRHRLVDEQLRLRAVHQQQLVHTGRVAEEEVARAGDEQRGRELRKLFALRVYGRDERVFEIRAAGVDLGRGLYQMVVGADSFVT